LGLEKLLHLGPPSKEENRLSARLFLAEDRILRDCFDRAVGHYRK
jgi:hypothetical protein